MLTITATMGNKQSMLITEDLKKHLLDEKTPEFLNAVGERGVEVAQKNLGYFAPDITVTHEVKGNEVIVTAQAQDVLKEWDGGHSEKVNPLLLAEFGSGFFAENVTDDPRGGQGKLNKYGHAFDSNGWYWKENGVLHHSYGVKPTMPMYRSWSTIVRELDKIAQSVFGG